MSQAELDAVRAMLASRPRPQGPEERRARLDALGQSYRVPADVQARPVQANGVQAEWTLTPGADPERVLLFLHGGGYMAGSLTSHRHLMAEAGRQLGARTLALHYRRAPENKYPAALEDTLAGYRFLLAEGVRPEHILLGGESAGGGLILQALLRLRDAGERLPGGAWFASPWIDLANRGSTMLSKAAADPMISKPYLDDLATQYLGDADPADPAVSPVQADLRGLPPMLIQVGSAETLLEDAVRLAEAAANADLRVSLQVWPRMIHAWHLFHQQLEEGRQSLAEVAAFAQAIWRNA